MNHEKRKSDGVRVYHKRKSDGVRRTLHHDEKERWGESSP